MAQQLPSPSVLLGIPNFSSWRPNQDRAFETIMDWASSDQRYLGLSASTGSGKSVLALLAAKMTGARTVILTATKGLQEQYAGVGGQLGLVSVKGQNNFSCQLVPGLRADEGPCHEGMPSCEYRTNGCRYREQLNKALGSSLIVTNYSYYLAQTQFSSGLGDISLCIADEAHLAFSAVENFMQIHLSRQETESLGLEFPRGQQDWSFWQAWASANLDTVSDATKDMEAQVKSARQNGDFVPSSQSRILRSYRATTHHLASMSTATGKWVVQAYPHGWQFTPVWIKDYNQLLPQSAPKVMLMSALLSEKTLDILGIPTAERKFFSIGSSFPPQNTPIWHIPTARINYQTDNSGTAIWLARIDQIISRRLDRKGIICTVSYARRDLILRRSMYSGLMMSHSTRDVVEMVKRFREAPAPCVFVSPSITSGYDIPECLVPGTLVRTLKGGYKPIEDVKVGELVLSGRGRFQTVTATSCRDYDGDIFDIESYGGYHHKLTSEHPVLTYGWKWTKAKDLVDGQKTLYPVVRRNVLIRGEHYGAKPLGKKYATGHNPIGGHLRHQWDDTPDFWRLVGLWAAEGSIHREWQHRKSCGHPRALYTINFDYNADEFETLAAETCRLASSVLGNSIHPFLTPRNGCRVVIKNASFAAWLKANVCVGAHNKRVPPRLFYASTNDARSAFVSGVLDGDGSITKWGGQDLGVVAPQLALGVRDLLLTLGKAASISMHEPAGSAISQVWRVRYDDTADNKYAKFTGYKNALVSRIRSITKEHYTGKVYNLSVNLDESYSLVGLCVHNCDYIIIGKLPYPDTTDLVLKARQADDDTWSSYLAMDTLINEAGRGTRSSTDKTEIFVIDNSITWFWKLYKSFAPVWFQQRYRGTMQLVPNPLFPLDKLT